MPVPPIKIIISGIDKYSRELAKASKGISKFGAKATAVGKKMTMALTLPIAAFGALSVRKFADYEESLARVQALIGATTEQTQQMGKITRTIGKTTMYGATQAAQGLEALTEAGFGLQESMRALPDVLRLATLAQIDMNAAVEAADMLADAYGVNIAEMAKTNDMLATASLKGEMGVGRLTKALQNFSPTAQALGINLQDSISVIATLNKAGLPLEKTMKSIQTGFLSLQTPTADMVKTFRKLGIRRSDLFDANNQLKSMTEVLKVFERAGANATDMAQIFGDSAGPGMAALLREGSNGLAEFQTNLTGTTGLADKLATSLDNTAKGKLNRFNAAINDLNIAFSETLMPILTPVIEGLTQLITKFGTLPPTVQKTVTWFVLIVAALGPMTAAIGMVASGIGGLLQWLPKVCMVLRVLLSILVAVGKFVAGFLTSAVGLSAAALAIWAYNIYKIYKGWNEIKYAFSGFKEFFSTIKFFIEDVATSLAKLALPKWLEKKLGLTVEKTGQPGAPGAVTAMAAGTRVAETNNKSTVKVSFTNIPKGTRIVREEGDVDLDTYYGPAFEGGY